MNVLLTHGYFIAEDAKEQKIMRPYPPLGILYISAYLKRNNISVSVFDSTFSSKQTFKENILNLRPKVVAFYVNLMTKLNVLELTAWIKTHTELSSTHIIFGGPDVTYNLENYLKAGADYIIIGEGEQTTLELISAITQNADAPDYIQGIAYLSKEGVLIKTPPRTKIKEVDTLPFPDREAIDLQKYLDTWKHFHGSSTISISTQRGCPYTCKWCSRAVYGQSYRRRSPSNVADELETLLKRYDNNTFWFVDDVFTVSHQWMEEFNIVLKERNLKIRYECITRADRMNEQVIRLLKESGCFRVWIGSESGSQKIIDAMDRRVDVNQVRSMIKLTKKFDMEAGTFIMLGYPGETKDDIEETIFHLKDSLPDHFTITVAYPIKGTPLFAEVENIQTHTIDWENATDRDRDFERQYPRSYYDYAVRRVVNEANFAKLKSKKMAFSRAGAKAYVNYQLAKGIMLLYAAAPTAKHAAHP